MALTSGFFNSLSGDRKYNADQFNAIFDGILNDGVLYVMDLFRVTPGTGLQVLVGTGRAWFNQTWTLNDAAYPINLAVADPSLARKDAIVLEVNKNTSVRANSLKVIKGTPSTSPSNPTTNSPTDPLCAHHVIAYVTVPAGATSIVAENITNNIGTSLFPFISASANASLTDMSYIYQEWTTQFNNTLAFWQNEFNTWYSQIQVTVSEKIVTNLQNQINTNKTSISSLQTDINETIPNTYLQKALKATNTEVNAKAIDYKYVTPYGLRTFPFSYVSISGVLYTIANATLAQSGSNYVLSNIVLTKA